MNLFVWFMLLKECAYSWGFRGLGPVKGRAERGSEFY